MSGLPLGRQARGKGEPTPDKTVAPELRKRAKCGFPMTRRSVEFSDDVSCVVACVGPAQLGAGIGRDVFPEPESPQSRIPDPSSEMQSRMHRRQEALHQNRSR